ncbi:MAG TPA: cytochrome c [Lacipirellulaceae bacterium]|nr:cytochrome c [Lacipirellulaceae bacterium]
MNLMLRNSPTLLAAALLVGAVGCTQAPPAEFHLNMVQAAAKEVTPEYQQEIANVLGALFGTPDKPEVLPESGLDQNLLDLAAGPAWTGPDDVTHGLYRRHCVHCHGISGDGRGPTAMFLDPYPRDYRKGIFKFKSTYGAEKPTNEDLTRIVKNGIPGTSMPSFAVLPEPEVEALVEYVKYLAIRGEMEIKLNDFVVNELGEEEAEDENGEPILSEDGTPQMVRLKLDPTEDPEQADIIKEELTMIAESWAAAQELVIVPAAENAPSEDRSPEAVAESVAAGRELFFSKRASCFTCHGPTALGDGQQNDYDDWVKDTVNLKTLRETTENTLVSLEKAPEEESDEDYADRQSRIERAEQLIDTIDEALRVSYPVRNAIPRNLRQGVYRGGRRRLDIFYRIHAGIRGVPMPGVGPTSPEAEPTLTEAEIWQLVDYVLALPYEAASGPNQDRPTNALPVTR